MLFGQKNCIDFYIFVDNSTNFRLPVDINTDGQTDFLSFPDASIGKIKAKINCISIDKALTLRLYITSILRPINTGGRNASHYNTVLLYTSLTMK